MKFSKNLLLIKITSLAKLFIVSDHCLNDVWAGRPKPPSLIDLVPNRVRIYPGLSRCINSSLEKGFSRTPAWYFSFSSSKGDQY